MTHSMWAGDEDEATDSLQDLAVAFVFIVLLPAVVLVAIKPLPEGEGRVGACGRGLKK